MIHHEELKKAHEEYGNCLLTLFALSRAKAEQVGEELSWPDIKLAHENCAVAARKCELAVMQSEQESCPQCAIEIKVRKDAGLSPGGWICKMCGKEHGV